MFTQISSALSKIEGVISHLPPAFSAEELKRISEDLRDIENVPLRVGVVGPFSSGKSSIVNALLGRDLLPVALAETTKTTFAISVASSPTEEGVELPDGTRQGLGEIGQVNVEKKQIVKVRVHTDSLPPGFELLDTPGLDSTNPVLEKITKEALDRVDVILLVLEAKQGVVRSILDFLKSYPGYAAKSYVVLNKADLLSEQDRKEVLEHNRKACGPLNPAAILLASTKGEPGVGELRELIIKELQPQMAAIKAERAKKQLRAVAENLLSILEEVSEAIELDTSEIDERIEKHRARRLTIIGQIEGRTAELFSKVKEECRATLIAFERTASGLVEGWVNRIVAGEPGQSFVQELRRYWEDEADRLSRRLERLGADFRLDVQGVAGDVSISLPWWTGWIEWIVTGLAALVGPLTGFVGNAVEALLGKVIGHELGKKIMASTARVALQQCASAWVREAKNQIDARLSELRQEIERKIRSELEPQLREVEGALEQLKAEKKELVLDVERKRKQVKEDQRTLKGVLEELKGGQHD